MYVCTYIHIYAYERNTLYIEIYCFSFFLLTFLKFEEFILRFKLLFLSYTAILQSLSHRANLVSTFVKFSIEQIFAFRHANFSSTLVFSFAIAMTTQCEIRLDSFASLLVVVVTTIGTDVFVFDIPIVLFLFCFHNFYK